MVWPKLRKPLGSDGVWSDMFATWGLLADAMVNGLCGDRLPGHDPARWPKSKKRRPVVVLAPPRRAPSRTPPRRQALAIEVARSPSALHLAEPVAVDGGASFRAAVQGVASLLPDVVRIRELDAQMLEQACRPNLARISEEEAATHCSSGARMGSFATE